MESQKIDWQRALIARFEQIADITVDYYKDTTLLCIFYQGKEIAHFHGQNEIDIRLTASIIRLEGIQPPEKIASHLNRPAQSRWIIQALNDEQTVESITQLIQLAISVR